MYTTTIQWDKDIEIVTYNTVSGDYANLEYIPNSPQIFKKGDRSKAKYVFKHGDTEKYIVFADDSIVIVNTDCFHTIV